MKFKYTSSQTIRASDMPIGVWYSIVDAEALYPGYLRECEFHKIKKEACVYSPTKISYVSKYAYRGIPMCKKLYYSSDNPIFEKILVRL